jgi:PAS domain S-box-containing protein
MNEVSIEILERALKRERAARKQAEVILEQKSEELFLLTQELQTSNTKLEKLVKEKTSELKGVFENIIDAYVVMDLAGGVIEMNKAAELFLGYSVKKGKINLANLVYPEDHNTINTAYRSLWKHGTVNNYQVRVVTKSGTIKLVDINASFIYDAQGAPIAVQGIIRDITKEKEAEEQLVASESRLATIILNLDSGVLLEDEHRKVVLVNSKFCELFSIPVAPGALVGADCQVALEESKRLFKDPEGFIDRISALLDKKEIVQADELTTVKGLVLERDYIPIFKKNVYKGHLWTYKDVTLKRKYRESIEAERRKYRNIIANMNLGLVEVDNNDKILMINQSFLKMSGYTEAELFGKEAGKLLHSEDASRIVSKENKKRKKGESNTYELKAETKSKEVREWLISSAPNYDDKGQVIGSIGIFLDITEAKRNAKLIEEQRKQLDTIVHNSTIGIVLTKRGQIIKTNAALQNMIGYSESELKMLSINDLSFDEDSSSLKAYVKKMYADKVDHFNYTKRYIKKDGSVIWTKTNVNIARDNDNKVKHEVVFIENTTSNRQKSLIIDLINNLTKSILDKTDIIEISWEIVNIIAAYLNSEDCVIYLVDHEKETTEQIAVYGAKLDIDSQIINKLFLPKGKGIVGSVVKSGKSELVNDTSKDGRYIVDDEMRFSEIVVPIISDGVVIGVIDSEHKDKNHFNEEQIKTLESIASLVAIKLRTAVSIRERKKAEARNEQLVIELEKSNDELQDYAHVVSHDLKSPLRSIYSLVDWIKEDNAGQFSEETEHNFSLISLTLEKMEQLILDVLEYSSVNSKNRTKVEVDLNEVIEDIFQIVYVPDHITIELKTSFPSIIGNRARLQQLFQNLISNALRYTDKKEGMIEISCKDLGDCYEFYVRDNGIGIAAEYHEKIFKIFQSLHQNIESTGVGLSIVKKIVESYQGKIWLDSTPGIGTTFYFILRKNL